MTSGAIAETLEIRCSCGNTTRWRAGQKTIRCRCGAISPAEQLFKQPIDRLKVVDGALFVMEGPE